MSNRQRKKYFYICEDCGEAIPTRIDSIAKKVTPYCGKCSARRLCKDLSERRNKGYREKFKESRDRNLIGRYSLYYGLYNMGYTDKEMVDILGMTLSGVASWRIRRSLPPNPSISDDRNSDGTFKLKSIRGSRDIYTHARDGLKDWKYNIMRNDKFKCKMCNGKKNIEVHHNMITFLNIMKIFLPNRDIEKELTWEEKKKIAEKIVKYHYKNNTSGITLCRNCHKDVHRNGDSYS